MTKDFQVIKTVWQELIQKWAFSSIQNDIDQGFEEIHPINGSSR